MIRGGQSSINFEEKGEGWLSTYFVMVCVLFSRYVGAGGLGVRINLASWVCR